MNETLRARARTYALRILARWMGARFPWRCLANNDAFWALTGKDPPGEDDAPDLPGAVREALAEAEATDPGTVPPHFVVARLGELLSLTATEIRILEFTLLANFSPAFDPVEAAESELTRSDTVDAVCVATGIARGDVITALRDDGALVSSGLIDELRDYRDRIRSKLDVEGPLDYLLGDDLDAAERVLEEITHRAPAPTLPLSAFSYTEPDLSVIRSIMSAAIANRTPGISILLYGHPGLGKTEFAHSVVTAAGGTAYEPGERGGRHDPDNRRSRAFAASQRVLANRRGAVLIMDEMEDVFSETVSVLSAMRGEPRTNSKAWLTRAVERSPVPTIWIANTLCQVESAILRRFTYAVEFVHPPRAVRRQIIEEQFRDLPVSAGWLDARAAETKLPPDVTALAARAATMSRESQSPQYVADRALAATRELLGLPEAANDGDGTEIYDIAFLNTGADIATLIDQLRALGEGRICLYGPPGTGKSALGVHIARELDRPLVRKTASDLLGPLVGETEYRIKRMFREAKRENAVLLLDEADSFLRDRRNAQHFWEVTAVNELLTQMERHEGVFICTTNLRDTLDPASVRRFDLKLHCDWLRLEQAEALACRHLEAVGLEWGEPGESLVARLRAISNLAPGDFHAVLRGVRLQGGLTSAGRLVSLLEAECAEKQDAPRRRAIGF